MAVKREEVPATRKEELPPDAFKQVIEDIGPPRLVRNVRWETSSGLIVDATQCRFNQQTTRSIHFGEQLALPSSSTKELDMLSDCSVGETSTLDLR